MPLKKKTFAEEALKHFELINPVWAKMIRAYINHLEKKIEKAKK
jgi:hypothetical protein